MSDEPTGRRGPALRLRAVPLGHLWDTLGGHWPGADGLTERDVLRSYPRLVAAGPAPGREGLLRGHPEWAAELDELFAAAGPSGPPGWARP
jgi:hypothetical protein